MGDISMKSLKEQIADFNEEKIKRIPKDILDTMNTATIGLKAINLEENTLKTGDKTPDFSLLDHKGTNRAISDYLKESTIVLSFYRGGWCPYCNLELSALQKTLPEIEQAGARLVAISPETPDHSLSTREKDELSFDILYDQGNEVARLFGLVFELPEALRPIYANLGIDIPEYNGDDTFKLPMPATYIINQDGEILYHFVDADYTQRSEPAEIVERLRQG